jgi:hypothetical protein
MLCKFRAFYCHQNAFFYSVKRELAATVTHISKHYCFCENKTEKLMSPEPRLITVQNKISRILKPRSFHSDVLPFINSGLILNKSFQTLGLYILSMLLMPQSRTTHYTCTYNLHYRLLLLVYLFYFSLLLL